MPYNCTLFLYKIHMHYKDIFLLRFHMKFVKSTCSFRNILWNFCCTRAAAGGRRFSIHTMLAWTKQRKAIGVLQEESPTVMPATFLSLSSMFPFDNFQRPRICIECWNKLAAAPHENYKTIRQKTFSRLHHFLTLELVLSTSHSTIRFRHFSRKT